MLSKLFLITSLGLCTSASAAPVLNFNESTGQSALPYAGTAGWLFYRNAAVSGDLTITGLSYWDANLNGLARSRQVGIWNTATGDLLRFATIPEGTAATLEGQWRTVAITPLTIPAEGADIYAIGGQRWYDDPDRAVNGTTLVYRDPRIGVLPNAYSSGQIGFAMPNAYSGTSTFGSFGPSFSVAPVPEPAGLCAMLASAGTLLLRRRR